MENNSPYKQISIIIASYNSEKYIKKCLDSLLEQSYLELIMQDERSLQAQPVEIVVVDDCSADNTPSIIKKYSEAYPDKIIFKRNLVHSGPSFTKNEGVKLARYNYIACIDCDTVIPSDWLEKGVLYFTQSKLFSGRYVTIPANAFEEAVFANDRFPDSDKAYKLGAEAYADLDVTERFVFFTREVFLAVGGFDIDIMACEGQLFLRQAIALGYILNYYHDLFVFYPCKNNLTSYIKYSDIIYRWGRKIDKISAAKRYWLSLSPLFFLMYVLLIGFLAAYKKIIPISIILSVSLILLVSFYILQICKTYKYRKNDYTLNYGSLFISGFLKIINLLLLLKIYTFRQRPKK